MRLIDADYFIEKLAVAPMIQEAMSKAVNHMPTVEVVMCKDCKWYKASKHQELHPTRFCYRLKNDDGVPVGYNWDGNDFCSYGERREDETD